MVSICGAPALSSGEYRETNAESYSIDNIMQLVLTGLHHQHGDVRHLAVEVSTLLFQQMGLQVLPYFKDIPANLIEILN